MSVAMGRGESIFWPVVYFADLSTCAKFQGRSSRASYLPQGSLMNMRSEKYASGAILGHLYADDWARYTRCAFIIRYYRISTTIVPSFARIAATVSKLRARQLRRNRHIVARSAKLLSPNAEIVSRLNSLILADRRLKCVPYKETGCEESKSPVGILTGSSFGRHFGEKPKIDVFLSPVFPLTLAMQGRHWGPSFSFWT